MLEGQRPLKTMLDGREHQKDLMAEETLAKLEMDRLLSRTQFQVVLFLVLNSMLRQMNQQTRWRFVVRCGHFEVEPLTVR